jgi:flagellin
MQESTNILQRMRDLSVQSANGSNSDSDRASLQKEVVALRDELTRIAETTTFGGQNLLDGSYGSQAFQIGSEKGQEISMGLSDMSASQLGASNAKSTGTAIGITTPGSAVTQNTAAGEITVKGEKGTFTTGSLTNLSAEDIAKAINAETGNTGVTAEGYNSVRIDSVTADNGTGAATTLSITSGTGGSEQDFTVTSYDAATLAAEINNNGNLGDVTASVDDSGLLVIESQSGQDIGIKIDSAGGSAADNSSMDISAFDANGDIVGSQATVTDSGTANTTVVMGSLTYSSGSSTNLEVKATNAALGNTTAETVTKASIQGLDISTALGAKNALDTIDAALQTVDDQRSDLGALQNRFESTISNLTNVAENVSAARSRIRDVDFAQETAKMSQNQILQQAGTTILAQANQLPQAALSLLG